MCLLLVQQCGEEVLLHGHANGGGKHTTTTSSKPGRMRDSRCLAALLLHRAVEEAVAGRLFASLESAKNAVVVDPSFPKGWLKLGVIHRMNGGNFEIITFEYDWNVFTIKYCTIVQY